MPISTVPVSSEEGAGAIALGVSTSVDMLVLDWVLPADISDGSELIDAEAFLFFDGFISAIFLARQFSIYNVTHNEKKTRQ